MEPRRVLARLRAGDDLTASDLEGFARGLGDGTVSDAQAAAFAMGVCIRGLSDDTMTALTCAMRDSGPVLRWDLPGPVLDKHSTGGLGDATSLVLAPVLAALGAFAPMLSGRGLGHTGGTLDKLEAIPGLSTTMSETRFRRIVGEVGCAIVGASDAIAPADARLYAIRDHTETVKSPALIVASILSKKLAGGAEALILDVKGGTGAFMATPAEARGLAQALVRVANAAGTRSRALITDMNQPLAPSIGNAVELREVLSVLRAPKPDQRLCRLVLALTGELLALAGAADTAEAGGRAALAALQSGAAAEKFGAMVAAMGGPGDFLERSEAHLPSARVVRPVPPRATGRIAAIDGRALGQVVIALGGGRQRPVDAVDPSVGLTEVASLGDEVGPHRPIALVHAASDAAADAAAEMVRAAVQIGPKEAQAPPLIHGRVA